MEERAATATLHATRMVEWRRDPRFGRTMARHLVDDVHSGFRTAIKRVVAGLPSPPSAAASSFAVTTQSHRASPSTAPPSAVVAAGAAEASPTSVSQFQAYVRNLEHHHQAEDQLWFPNVSRETPELRPYVDYLSMDHQHWHPLEVRVVKHGDADAIREFESFLSDHLNREELLTVPLLMSGRGGI